MNYMSSELRYKYDDEVCYRRYSGLTDRWVRGFEAAKNASTHSDGYAVRDRMGAAIFHGRRVLSVGHNTYQKTKPGNLAIKADGKIHTLSLHAEQMAVNRIRHYEYSSKLICYVVRVNAFGQYVTSKPCRMCLNYLKEHNIQIVRFINEVGLPEEIRL